MRLCSLRALHWSCSTLLPALRGVVVDNRDHDRPVSTRGLASRLSASAAGGCGRCPVATVARGSRSAPTGTCSPRSWRRWPAGSNWLGTRPWRSGYGPGADQRNTASAEAQVGDLFWWRRLRGSNPRGGCNPLHAFQACAFDRSAKPPPGSVHGGNPAVGGRSRVAGGKSPMGNTVTSPLLPVFPLRTETVVTT